MLEALIYSDISFEELMLGTDQQEIYLGMNKNLRKNSKEFDKLGRERLIEYSNRIGNTQVQCKEKSKIRKKKKKKKKKTKSIKILIRFYYIF